MIVCPVVPMHRNIVAKIEEWGVITYLYHLSNNMSFIRVNTTDLSHKM